MEVQRRRAFAAFDLDVVHRARWACGCCVPLLVGEPSLYITAGVLQNVRKDRLAVLEAVNSWTRENPGFACYFVDVILADGTRGWDIVMQQKYSLKLMIEAPEFVKASIQLTPLVLNRVRASAARLGLGGSPFTWIRGHRPASGRQHVATGCPCRKCVGSATSALGQHPLHCCLCSDNRSEDHVRRMVG
jgi:hypothetical protein